MKLIRPDGSQASFNMDGVDYETDETGVIDVPEEVGKHLLQFPVHGFQEYIDPNPEITEGTVEEPEPVEEPEDEAPEPEGPRQPVHFQIDGTVEEPEQPAEVDSAAAEQQVTERRPRRPRAAAE